MTDGFTLPIRIPLSLWQRVAMAVVFTVLLLVAVAVAQDPGGGRAVSAAMGVASAVMLYRVLRMGLVIDDSGITSRTVEWTHRIAWCEIASVDLADAGSIGSLSKAPALRTHKGRRVVLRSLAGYSTRGTVTRLEQTKAQFEATLAGHRTSCATCARSGRA
ncbi:hypothetical protein ACFU7Y_19275 [Kitasatospora sp. NPDC057542]|uniref:hypothetical protein n=1 Tax=Kitasatospora sp. NPDC057542 TaxID=3346162 RepID=UPI003680DE44